MKLYCLLLAGLTFAVSCSSSEKTSQTVSTDTDELLQFQEEITPDFMEPRLSAFAADSMEGRETGTRGEEKAANYLAEQYEALGLTPVGDDDTFQQQFELTASIDDSVVFETKTADGKILDRSVASREQSGNYVRSFGGTDSLEGEIVFAGFGIVDEERNLDHLEKLDLEGKWVMVFQDLPNVSDGDTLFDPNYDQQERFQTIMQQGAEGMLLIPAISTQRFEDSARQTQESYGDTSSLKLPYLDEDSEEDFSKGYNLINPQTAARLLDFDGGTEQLLTYREKLMEDLANFEPRVTGIYLSHTPYESQTRIESQNIAALFEGTDPELKDEVIVLTSHYDHVGIGEADSTGDRIYNGADDDGSGTIGMLNMAHALATAKENNVMPKRSVLFLHVSAEEKGLLGSRYYSDHPLVPIEKTITNLNADMIGRIDPENEQEGNEDYAYIIGGKIISSQLDSMLSVANEQAGNVELNDRYNDLQDPNQFYRRSDHWNLGRLGVPFIFFFTGVHEDYHKPGDEADKILYEKTSKIVQTIYATTIMLANTDSPPEVDNREFIEITEE